MDLAIRQERPQTTPLPLEAYSGTYERPVLGRMVWTIENRQLQVRMGVARGNVEVYSGAKNQFRVGLTERGSVVEFIVPENARQPIGLRFVNQMFTRVP